MSKEKKVKAVFGLVAQGHIPTIEQIIEKHNESYKNHFPDDKPLNMMFTKYVWEDIGKQIGWCPFTASLAYFKYLESKKQ